jgi:FlaA1/EpsC-like NDP-sugar epimerase
VVLRVYDAPVLQRSFFIVLVDIALVVCSVYAAIGLKYDDWGLIGHRQLAIAMVSVLAPLTVVVLWLMRLYRGSWRVAGIYDILRVGLAISFATLVGFVVFRPVTRQTGPISLFLVYALLNVAASAACRLSFRVLDLFRARASTAGVPTLIYGAGRGGATALGQMLARPDFGLRAVGFIDDNPSQHGRFVHGLPVRGTVRELEARIRERQVGAVVIATRKVPGDRIAEAAAACERTGARLMRMEVRFDECVVPSPNPPGPPC